MTYIVISANSQGGLVMDVAAKVEEGWQLQGGVSVCPIDDASYPRGTLVYSQAMILNLAQ
jgi:hypothetical protein